MRLGLALPHYDTSLAGKPVSWGGVRDVALLAEASGFSSVWVSDHLFLDWSKYGGPSDPQGALECWTTMTALAGATSKVRIGSLALCNDFRNPALVAKMAATLDLMSGGRLDLGMGGGWYEPEYRAAGIPFDGAGTRIRRLGEAVEIVTRLLAGEELSFKGDHYTIEGAIVRPGPHSFPRPPLNPRPPVFIGGKGDLLIRTAAKAADGWNFSWIGSTEAYFERVAYAHKACEKLGRDPATLARSVGAYVLVGRDERDLERRYGRLVERTPKGVFSASSGVYWEGFRQRGIAGTVSEVVGSLGELKDNGVEEVVVTLGALPFQLSDEEDVELFGSEVIPALAR